MMDRIAAFAVLSLILTVTPGPDSLLVLRSSLRAGRRAGVQLAGACYLLFLGIRGWRAAAGHATEQAAARPGRSPGFRTGLLSNLLNPKVGLFFLTVMPQLIPHHANVIGYALAFAVTDALIAGSWLAIVAWLSGKARTLLGRPRVRAALDRAAGTALVALGVKVAAEQFI